VVAVAPPAGPTAHRPVPNVSRPSEPPRQTRRRNRRVSWLAALITVMAFVAIGAFVVAVLSSR